MGKLFFECVVIDLTSSKRSLAILYGLIFCILFYRMQLFFYFPFSAISRFLIYVCLLAHVVCYRRDFHRIPSAMFFLLGSMIFVGVNTAIISSIDLAVHASARMVNVMCLAYFSFLILKTERHVERVFWLFWTVFFVALISLLFQYCGGGLNLLVKDYIAIRGDLIRYMTIVGEPNVGGMLAVIAFVTFIFLVKRRDSSIFFGGIAVTFVFFSISKAAMLGVVVAVVAGIFFLRWSELKETIFRALLAGFLGVVFLYLLSAENYLQVSVDSVLGGIRGEPSAFEDLHSRQMGVNLNLLFKGSNLPPPLNYILGVSFADVGSAAQEIRGPNSGVVLPHNSYLELLLTGGVFMLSSVLFMMVRAFRTLWRSSLQDERRVDRCLLLCLSILSCWMLVYPVIYEPVTGCLFWIIVGYGNRMHRGSSSKNLLAI